jgi:hypothetical protein
MWLPKTNGHALRRLQLAAQKGNTLGFMFSAASSAKNPSPAALRILASAIQPDESQPSESQFNESKRSGIREQAVRISIMKQRGGWPGADVDIRLNAQVGHARHEHAHTTVNEKDGNYFPLRPRREVRPEMH